MRLWGSPQVAEAVVSTGASVRLLPALGWVEQQQSAATGTDAAPEHCLVLSEADARRAVHHTCFVALGRFLPRKRGVCFAPRRRQAAAMAACAAALLEASATAS